jgi:molybdenum cofactor synthesis domain-containing protein
MRSLVPGEAFRVDDLPTPGAAIAAFLRAVPLAPLGVEHVPLAAAAGRVLAHDAVADVEYPADDRSTMDGFAVRSSEGRSARVIRGAVRMGHAPPHALGAGEAMRIPTGGVLPDGADAVVAWEDADEDAGLLTPHDAPAAGEAVTRRGDDMRAGDTVLHAGRRIGAPELSVLATVGLAEVPVFRIPRIAIVSTGDELVAPDARPQTGQIRDSNRWAIAGALIAAGCTPIHLPIGRDEPAEIAAQIAAGLALADGVILTGGSSVGGRDHTPAAIDACGAPGVIVHGIKVKPGKPTVLAAIGAKPVIGLPGNPASALTILTAVCAPLLHALTGASETRGIATTAATEFAGRRGWTWYVPAVLDSAGARPLVLRSAHTSLLARADGYVIVGPDDGRIAAGAPLVLHRYGVQA